MINCKKNCVCDNAKHYNVFKRFVLDDLNKMMLTLFWSKKCSLATKT